MSDVLLRVVGEVETPLALSFSDLVEMPEAARVQDVSQLDPRREGVGILLSSLLEKASPREAATHLTLHASKDDFAASVPLELVLEQGVLIYQVEGDPLPAAKGGPARFLVPEVAACHQAELDECANVKFVDCLELTTNPGRDTRPSTEGDHEALHRDG